MLVRRFEISDSSEVSSVIRRAILCRDNRGYSIEQIYSIANHYSAENLCTDLNNKISYVALENEVIVGTATLYKDEVMAVFIVPEFQNIGVGKRFMEVIETDAIKKGLKRLWCVSALPAADFYKKLGYTIVSEKIHPLWGTGIVFEKILS